MHPVRALLYGLAILHLGPGVAFGVLAFGCEGAAPALGAVCNKGTLASFALLTVGSWLILESTPEVTWLCFGGVALLGFLLATVFARLRLGPLPASSFRSPT